MKIGKFTVLAVSAGLIALGMNHPDINPNARDFSKDPIKLFTYADATSFWNTILNKDDLINEINSPNVKKADEKKVVNTGFNPMLEPPINDNGSPYITKDEAEKLLKESISNVKVMGHQIDKQVNSVLEKSGKGMDQLISGDIKENANEVKKVIKAEFAPLNKENFVKTKDGAINSMIGALEKLRSEPKKENSNKNQPGK